MESDNPVPVPVPEGAFVEEERYMINGVLSLASRSLRGIMTPRGEISWVDADLSVEGNSRAIALVTTQPVPGVSWRTG